MSEPHNAEVQLALLEASVAKMESDLVALRQEIKDLVDAWRTATNVLAFVKWLAGIGTAAAFLWAGVKGKFGG